MKNKNNSKQNPEIDFVSSSSFQRSIKKAKWKQILLYTLISVATVTVFMVLVHLGAQYLIDKKIEKEVELHSIEPTQGANISNRTTRYYYNTFSAIGETTYYKKIGNRNFVWDTVVKKYPAIGRVETLNQEGGMTEINVMDQDAQRTVRYNQLNNERIVDFYYPSIEYNYLPQELSIATELEENKLIEVALSFYEPLTVSELSEILGYMNVDWLWVNLNTEEQMKRLKEVENDTNKVENGDEAYGISVSQQFPYGENLNENTTINGAVVSGTPQELKRFQKLDIIRSSVIGAAIDKY